MTPKPNPKAFLSNSAYDDLGKLPGNIRRQMITLIDGLQVNPRPHFSKQLVIDGEETELRRLRSGKWRIIYLVINERPMILAIRKRPPYDYQDLQQLIDR